MLCGSRMGVHVENEKELFWCCDRGRSAPRACRARPQAMADRATGTGWRNALVPLVSLLTALVPASRVQAAPLAAAPR